MGRAARNPDTGLTDKEEVFCQKIAYNPEMTDSDAYRAAYNCERMKPETVNNKAYQLKNKGEIRARIDFLRKELSESVKRDAIMTREEALERLSRSARVTILDVAEFSEVQVGEDENGDPIMSTVWRIKNSAELTPETAAAIKSVTATKMGPKLELHDSLSAVKQLADMEGWNAAKETKLSGGVVVEEKAGIDLSALDAGDRKALKAILERNAKGD